MKFVTLFPNTQNVHLLKDLGMIPYYLYKQHGYDSYIVTYESADGYSYLKTQVQGLKLEFLKKSHLGKVMGGARYLRKKSKEIDVLNVYHLNLASFIWILIYQKRKPKGGKVYLKLDMSYKGLRDCLAKNPIGWIKRKTIQMADIVSAETTLIQSELQKVFQKEILYIPNGFSLPTEAEQGLDEKENIILTVGNLGTIEKATDTLMEAFALFSRQKASDWKMRLVGPIAQKFEPFINQFFEKYPGLQDSIVFIGAITDKVQLAKEYEAAKIFVLPSRQESFGIVLTEAISRGCYTITATGAPAGYDVSDKGRLGRIFETDQVDQLAAAFAEVCAEDVDWNARSLEIKEFARQNFLWETIIHRLHQAIMVK